MLKIVVDKSLCSGHAQCNAVRPDLFELDEDGYVNFGEREVSADRAEDARVGAAACPERAISVEP